MTISIDCNHGRRFELDAGSAALVVIDMQRDFLDPGGMVAIGGGDVSGLRAIVPAVSRVLAAARRAGIKVIHTREGYAADGSDMHALKRERRSAGESGPLGRFLIRGEPGHAIVDELAPIDGEAVFDKPGFGAFYRTALQSYLEDEGITHLLVCGITTQCCVQSTLREAVDRGYWCLTLEDCCAAVDPALHEAAISLIYGESDLFGWVSQSSVLVEALESVEIHG